MAGATITVTPDTITEGGIIKLRAAPGQVDPNVHRNIYAWTVQAGSVQPLLSESDSAEWDTTGLRPSVYEVQVSLLQLDAQAKVLHRWSGVAAAMVTERLASASAPGSTATASAPGSATVRAGASAPAGAT